MTVSPTLATETPSPELLQTTKIVDAAPYFDTLQERFGIPHETFQGLCLVQANSKILHIVNATHQPPLRPKTDGVGMPFLRINMAVFKLTTPAAMRFGNAATKNILADAPQPLVSAYLARQTFDVTHEQAKNFTGRGYVLIGYQNRILGLGFFQPAVPDSDTPNHDSDIAGQVESFFPKAWSLADDCNPFGDEHER